MRGRCAELSDQDRKSDPRETPSHHRLPPRIILPRPAPGGIRVVEDVTVPRISGELAPDLLGDGPEVAQHSRYRAVPNRRRELGARAYGADEVVDVKLR